jgi:hypothetical protein
MYFFSMLQIGILVKIELNLGFGRWYLTFLKKSKSNLLNKKTIYKICLDEQKHEPFQIQ